MGARDPRPAKTGLAIPLWLVLLVVILVIAAVILTLVWAFR